MAQQMHVWRWWTAGTIVAVAAFIGTPSELNDAETCSAPPAWLLVHPEPERERGDPAAFCNDHARKRSAAGAFVAVVGAAFAVRSRHREGDG